jgi:hypothetical protein
LSHIKPSIRQVSFAGSPAALFGVTRFLPKLGRRGQQKAATGFANGGGFFKREDISSARNFNDALFQ